MAVQYLPPICPIASSLASPILFDGSLSTGDFHKSCASTKSIPCFVRLATDFAGSNSNSISLKCTRKRPFPYQQDVSISADWAEERDVMGTPRKLGRQDAGSTVEFARFTYSAVSRFQLR